MSDLISRSALLNAFDNTGIQITFDLPVEEILGEDVDIDDFSMLVQDAIKSYRKMVIDTIKNQPTAFDTEKVVEQLEEMKSLSEDAVAYEKRHGNIEDRLRAESSLKELNRVIDIVKKGGVE